MCLIQKNRFFNIHHTSRFTNHDSRSIIIYLNVYSWCNKLHNTLNIFMNLIPLFNRTHFFKDFLFILIYSHRKAGLSLESPANLNK